MVAAAAMAVAAGGGKGNGRRWRCDVLGFRRSEMLFGRTYVEIAPSRTKLNWLSSHAVHDRWSSIA